MFKNNRISVIVPAYNESKLIITTIQSIPDFIDEIVIVDDASIDDTLNKISKIEDKRIILISHVKNMGVGGAIITGYKKFLDGRNDIAVVIAADNQMDPSDLPALIDPLVSEKYDYAKGNRLFYKNVFRKMPKVRFFGNAVLTLLSKIATGYWQLVDFQCGYTAITRKILNKIDMDKIYKRYGFPNDFLVKLSCVQAKVIDIQVRPVYANETSGIRIWKVLPIVSLLLLKGFFYRLWIKNILRDFHPFVFLYFFGIVLTLLGSSIGIWILILKYFYGKIATVATIIFCALAIIIGLQSLLFAMMFDMINNKYFSSNDE